MNRKIILAIALPALCSVFSASRAQEPEIARDHIVGSIELVASFNGPMPTGVTVSNDGRIFVNFPKWGDNVEYTVAEIIEGKTYAYPDAAINHFSEGDKLDDKFVSVQSVVVDPTGQRLWILDTGSIQMGPVKPGGPKMFAVDLKTNQIVKKILFPADVALPTTYLNDVRFDLHRGKEGIAYITDSATNNGSNGIIVVDLASGKSWRRLNDHPSTKPDPNFIPIVEGEELHLRIPGKPPAAFGVGSDGIALSADRRTLYYCPLTSRHLYTVSADALADQSVSDANVAATVKDLGDKGASSDGLEADAQGRLYLSDYEHDRIARRAPDGETRTLAHDPRMLWPDTLSLAANGYLYFIVNQIERQAVFHNGEDQRKKPYALYRLKVDASRISN